MPRCSRSARLNRRSTALTLLLTAQIGVASMTGAATHSLELQDGDRIVCLGDSITDGYTYGQIIMQALREADKPVPVLICAGVASDTAPQMAARVEATVLAYKPKVVTLSAGTNDALRNVTPSEYQQALREISRKVKAQGGSMILLTPCVILSKQGQTEAEQSAHAETIESRLDAYEATIRARASEERYPVAENRKLMQQAVEEGRTIMSADGIHPDYHGQSLMARSILDALGQRDVPLPAEFHPKLFPGIIPEWRMRLAPLDDKKQPERLTAESLKELQPDETWQTYALPDPAPANQPTARDWWEQERRNGFANRVEEQIGKGLVQAVAAIQADREKNAYISVGVGISTVWLNGLKLHDQGQRWTGFHAGKERIPVTLKKGSNQLVVEIQGNTFFLSVTDELVWEKALGK